MNSRPGTIQKVGTTPPHCLLIVGSQRLTAVLGAEQGLGLHVLVQGNPIFWVNDTGVLQMSEVDLTVRVSNIVCLESSEEDFSRMRPAFRIGLEPLGETAKPKSPAVRTKTTTGSSPRIDILRALLLRYATGKLIGIVLLVTPLLFVAAAWHHHIHDSRDALPVVAPSNDHIPPATHGEPAHYAMPEPSPETLRLAGIEPFLTAEVAAKLELTPLQRSKLGEMHKQTQQALVDLEKYWESPGRLELARRRNWLLDGARQEALEVLSEQQRLKWEAMAR
jgi:hypothetical protein